MVDGDVEFFLLLVEVEVGQEGVLNSSLNGYLLLVHDDLVGLINGELIFGHFGDVDELILRFHNMAVVDLLVDCSCGLVHQPYLVILIGYYNRIEVRKHLKISDYFVYGKGDDLRRMAATINRKNSDDSFLSA